jgi:hypothetical protein
MTKIKKSLIPRLKSDWRSITHSTNVYYYIIIIIIIIIISSSSSSIFSGCAAQRGLWAPRITRFLDHIQRRATVGRTPLDE